MPDPRASSPYLRGQPAAANRPTPVATQAGAFGLDILILARNEADVLAETLAAVRAQAGPADCLHVVADHCRDGTPAIAAQGGAIVHHRWSGRAGKGFAISWWLDRPAGSYRPGVLILDADSIPGPRLLDLVRDRLIDGALAVQAFVQPVMKAPDPIAVLSAFSELKEQIVWDRFWAGCGAPVRLRGTGMAFDREVLRDIAPDLRTVIEDAELSLLLSASGVHIHRLSSALVFDPKPIDSGGAARQRARWLRGQWQVIHSHPRAVGKLLLGGPSRWPLLASLLIKPRSLILPVAAAVAIACTIGWAAGVLPPLLVALAWAPVLLEVVTVGAGLALLSNPSQVARLLWAWPRYLGMWLGSLHLALGSRHGWLRARAPGVELAAREPRSAGS
jgi:cellulose synthase/poly-beta-1,6-N-acetylglucosamine synthase-like glycosyltransferase